MIIFLCLHNFFLNLTIKLFFIMYIKNLNKIILFINFIDSLLKVWTKICIGK